MKTLTGLLLLCVLAGSAFTQAAPAAAAPPDLEIVFAYVGTHNSWQLAERYRSFPAPGLQGGYAAELGADPGRVQGVREVSRRQVATQYALLRVKNTGTKTIKTIEWEAPHMNFKDGQLLWRLAIKRKVNLPAAATALLKETLQPHNKRLRLSALTDAAGNTLQLGQAESFTLVQRASAGAPSIQFLTFTSVQGQRYTVPADWQRQPISLKRIEYADGTVWQRQ
ncbi:MAG: hypothetical protein HYR56_00745 [Acidobacteria bacterium]|nr:hypothetical protein [Acidobacteriota bacterium]MBI3422659.1 hypothetical protein [Acidobacteriota bacterium]